MSAKGIIEGYKAKYYAKPVLKTWKPTKFDFSFYNTEKKLAKEAEKRNAEFKREYDRSKTEYDAFCAKCEKIVGLGAENLRDFFVKTIQDMVEEARAKRLQAKAKIAEFKEKYDVEVTLSSDGHEYKHKIGCEMESIFHRNFRVIKSRGRLIDGGKDSLELLDDKQEYTRRYLDALCPSDNEKMAFGFAYLDYKKNCDIVNCYDHHPAFLFISMVERIADMIDDIRKVLGGYPDGCSFDTDWGVGGHFNGIVSRGDKRASFKSFFAGGYNIQKLHIRFRVTLLKGRGA